ncbi:Os08g0121925, partial [Oryza sativa Japonica Group]
MVRQGNRVLDMNRRQHGVDADHAGLLRAALRRHGVQGGRRPRGLEHGPEGCSNDVRGAEEHRAGEEEREERREQPPLRPRRRPLPPRPETPTSPSSATALTPKPTQLPLLRRQRHAA